VDGNPADPFRTKIIFLMKASGALDFDVRRPEKRMLNASSDADGLVWTTEEVGKRLGMTKFRVRRVDEFMKSTSSRTSATAVGRRAPGPRPRRSVDELQDLWVDGLTNIGACYRSRVWGFGTVASLVQVSR
jgi:hypothetical protein